MRGELLSTVAADQQQREAMLALLVRAQLHAGRTDDEVVRAAVRQAALAVDDASWRARWHYVRAVALMNGDQLDGAADAIDASLAEARAAGMGALVALAHAMLGSIAAARGRVDLAVELVGRAIGLAEGPDRATDVRDWAAALLAIGNALLAIDLLEVAEEWYGKVEDLASAGAAPIHLYAAAWNRCAVAGSLALGSVRRPPFRPDGQLFAAVAERGVRVDRLAEEYRFEEPGWGGLWEAVADAYVGDPDVARVRMEGLISLRDDRSLQRSAGDVWRAAWLRSMQRLGRSADALAEDLTRPAPADGPSLLGAGYVEALTWERLMAATAGDPAARRAAEEHAAVVVHRRMLGAALANDQLVVRAAHTVGEQERIRLADQAARDPLTGLLNRRGMEIALQSAAEAATGSYALFVVDVDGFKRVNDEGSHAKGDAVLQRVATVLSSSARAGDAVSRFGGDEFMVIAAVEMPTAAGLGERLSAAVRAATADVFAVSVSVGVAVRSAPVPVDEWVLAADEAMFAAKRSAPGSVRAVELTGVSWVAR